MAINQLDMGAVFNNALGTVAAHRGMQQQQEYRNFLRDNGEALMAGDPGALAGYAQYDPGGALSMRNNMNSERREADLYKRQVAEFAANKSAAELQAEIQKTDQILMGAAHFYESKDPQGYAAFLSQNGIDPQKYPFQQFPAYARQFQGARDVLAGVLERQAPKGPLSSPGKVSADIAAGYLPEGTPLWGSGNQFEVTNGDFSVRSGQGIFDVGGGQPTAVAPPASGQPKGDARQAFGVKGAATNAANTVVDAVTGRTPFPETADTVADFNLELERTFVDLVDAYKRQPASKFLEDLRNLIPKAGQVFTGPGKAERQLNAIKRTMEREYESLYDQLNAGVSRNDAAELRQMMVKVRSGIDRVDSLLGQFGGAHGWSGGGMPQLFVDSLGELDGLTAEDVWATMSDDEKAAFQQ